MKLSFHGGVRGVTGSCYRLIVKDDTGNEHQYLFDCGLFQGEHMCGDQNFQPFGFEAKQIEAVFITHPHADHTGRLAKLVDEGFEGPIYMTRPCVGLSKLVLEDAYHIMKEEAKRCGTPVLYEIEDLEKTFSLVHGVGYHEEIQPASGMKVYFHDAGHVLGSAYISMEAEGKRVIFSGDIGNDDVPILPETEPISRATAVVCESTYGHRVHEPTSEREEKLRKVIVKTIEQKSVLLIPAFSIERTQELLYALDQILEHDLHTTIPVYLDSPMAIKATHLYRHFKHYLKFDTPILHEQDNDFFSFKNLRETLRVEESKTINDVPAPKVIIAGSGMMSGGRIMHHLIRYLPDPNTIVLIIGYQAQGTLGRRIYAGAKEVQIFGQQVEVRAKTMAIGAFSAHADKHKLMRWLKPQDGQMPKHIFLTHGDPEAKEVFATYLRDELGTNVVIPAFQSTHEI